MMQAEILDRWVTRQKADLPESRMFTQGPHMISREVMQMINEEYVVARHVLHRLTNDRLSFLGKKFTHLCQKTSGVRDMLQHAERDDDVVCFSAKSLQFALSNVETLGVCQCHGLGAQIDTKEVHDRGP